MGQFQTWKRSERVRETSCATLAFVFAASAQIAVLDMANAADAKAGPVLVRVLTKSAKSHVGELVREDEDGITILELAAGQEVIVPKRETLRVVNPLSLDEAARAVGLPMVSGWRISQFAAQEKPLGKIAQVTSQVVYVTIGSDQGATQGQKLIVFRNKGEIKDPDSGVVLAVERPRVAELEIVEVNAAFSKARIQGNLEVTLEVGDEVEPDKHGLRVAVCPLLNEDGTLTSVGASLAEDLVTTLVQRNVTVVERSVLDMVLGELLVQNSVLFDQQSAQKLGKLTGANVVLTGKIVPERNAGKAYVRLIDVQSGEILFAISSSVNLVGARQVNRVTAPGTGPENAAPGNGAGAAPAVAGGSRTKLGASRSMPTFLATSDRYERAQDGGIRLLGKDPAVQTRELKYFTKDFTYEVLLTFAPTDRIAVIGLGRGKPDPMYNVLAESVYLRFHAPNLGGQIDVTAPGRGYDGLGHVKHIGTHLVRITKEGDTVTFQVDPDADGPSDDDLELTISNIREYAPFFNSKNMPLFFGGNGTFLEISIQE